MNDILDETEKPNNNKRFSILSLIFSLVTISLLVYYLFLRPSVIKVKELYQQIDLLIVIRITFIMGVTFTTLSYYKKEQTNKFKLIGTILNSLLVILAVLLGIWILILSFV